MTRLEPMIAVLITCFNRRETTMKCLRSLEAAVNGRARYRVYLVDAGSKDGTVEAVRSEFPEVQIINDVGDVFWNEGMRVAWGAAQSARPDFYLWLNDDVALFPESIQNLLELYGRKPLKTLVVGTTTTPGTDETSYGGKIRKSGLSRLSFEAAASGETTCETMNGNCVLLPASAADDVGINSDAYRHAMGDMDYGLRARRHGYEIWQCAVPVAELARNPMEYGSAALLASKSWRYILNNPKAIPVAEWLHFTRQHGGTFWPINFVLAYLRVALAKAKLSLQTRQPS